MSPCCRDTVAILSAAAAVWGCPATQRIISSLPRVQEPCEVCKAVAKDFDQRRPGRREAPSHEVFHAIGHAIAYVLEEGE